MVDDAVQHKDGGYRPTDCMVYKHETVWNAGICFKIFMLFTCT